jgi:hypothetical protein
MEPEGSLPWSQEPSTPLSLKDPKYLNCATFSKDLLAIFVSWFCPAFWWQDSNVYLVFSALASRPTSSLALLACNWTALTCHPGSYFGVYGACCKNHGSFCWSSKNCRFSWLLSPPPHIRQLLRNRNMLTSFLLPRITEVKWAPFHQSIARPQVANGGNDLQIRRVAASRLNKQ